MLPFWKFVAYTVLSLLTKRVCGPLPMVLLVAKVIPFSLHVALGHSFGRFNDMPTMRRMFQTPTAQQRGRLKVLRFTRIVF